MLKTLASLIHKQPSQTLRPPAPTFVGKRVGVGDQPFRPRYSYLIEHGASATLFINAIGRDLDHKPRLRSVIIRALIKYMDDHGPIGEGRVLLCVGTICIASFRIEENPRDAVRILTLMHAGPEASVTDWISLSSVPIPG